jgi:Cyclic nucleotide-binding domain/Major Facilitator Superfamily
VADEIARREAGHDRARSKASAQWELTRRVLRVRELRVVAFGYAAFALSEHATWLAVLVYAMQNGGPREVGAVAVLQLVPGVLLAPFAAYAGDRFAPQRALAAGYAAQCVSMAATAVAMAAGAPVLAYAGAVCAATCITFTRPVVGSLLPTLTHAPRELIAANVVTGFIEQIGVFIGPLIAGVIMALATPGLVFGVATLATGAAFLSALLLDPVETSARAPGLGAGEIVSQVFAGFATLRQEGRLRVLVWLGATAGIVRGIGDVIFVTFADARLGGGGGQSGLLAGAYGLGAISGAAAFAGLAHGTRLGRQFVVSGLFASIPLLGLAPVDRVVPALAGFAALGAGETMLGLTSSVTIQRQAPGAVLARVFGILEGLQMGAIALGSLAVTWLVASTSIGPAFATLAAVVLLMVLGGVARLRRHGDEVAPVDESVVTHLLADPVFAPLPAPTIERLARNVRTVTFGAGDVVVSQGDPADGYYVVVDGVLDVTIDGRSVRQLGPGLAFGEIALLREVPRTATVTATTPVELLAVARDDFIEAVTGHPRSLRTATDVVDRFLGP